MKTTYKVKVEIPTEFPFVVTNGNSTVKIFRVNSSKNRAGCYYQIADYTGPKRKLISKADFWEAKAEAERIAKLQRAGETHALEMRGPERAAYGQAIALLAGTGTPLVMAAALFAEAATILGDGRKVPEAAKFFMARHPSAMPSKTVSEVVAEMIALKSARGHAPRYVEDLNSRLARFEQAFPGKLVDVDTQGIQKWLDKLRRNKKGTAKLALSNQSLNNYRTVIHSFFSFAERRGYIAKGTNPVEGIERAKAKPGAAKIFSPGEFFALLNAADADFQPLLAICGLAGLRSAEAIRLDWSEIHLDGPEPVIEITAGKAKTASRRTVPICKALAAWLQPHAKASGPIWEGNDDSLCDAQYRTAKAAGITWKANALRHSYASYRLADTGDAARTAYELGNSAAIVHRHYKALVSAQDAKAWFSVLITQAAAPAQLPIGEAGL